jgi:hypothetical protein
MSQDNNQNDRQNRQGQGDNWQGESQGQQGQRDDWQGESQGQGDQSSGDMTRESRSSGYSDPQPNQGDRRGNQAAPELEEMDELDEDRDDDDRLDGSPNRRHNIG